MAFSSRCLRFGKTATIASALVLAFACEAFAQASPDMTAMSNRLAQLERQIQTLSRQVSRSGAGAGAGVGAGNVDTASPAGAPGMGAPMGMSPQMGSSGAPDATMGMPTSVAAGIEVRLTQLEAQMRNITGTVEEAVHKSEELNKRVDKIVGDVEAKLRKVSSAPVAVASAPAAVSSTAKEPAKPEPVVEQPVGGAAKPLGIIPANGSEMPEEVYEKAFSQLGKTQYAEAEADFRKFLATYPDHKLAANAQYWLAESYYVRGQMNEAAVAFAEGYQKYPDAQKAPDNLLKLGMTLAQLGRRQDACLTWGQADKRFPNAAENIRTRIAQEKTKSRCE